MNNNDKLVEAIVSARPGFASITYRSKGDNTLARYTIILGASYDNLLHKSLAKLEEIEGKCPPEELEVVRELKISVQNSINARVNGEQNPAYTKAGMYLPLANGLNINTNDSSLQLFGSVQSKVVIEPGIIKKVNSSPKTILKNSIRQQLPMSKFREFALDEGHVLRMKIQGDTLILE